MIDPREAVRRVVIVGGGTAGWMAAAAIARVLGPTPGLSVTLVESEAIGTVGVGESTIPQINLFNAMLGIDEAAFVRATHATYKMGIEFIDWTRIGDRFVHPFGAFGLDMLGIDFHHVWLKGRALGDDAPLGDYSLSAVGAMQERFAHPRPDLPNSPLSKIGYAFQFDAGLYARFLRTLAERDGVRRIEGRIVAVTRGGDAGLVEAVTLDTGMRIEGDLFIDCSGFAALLIQGAMTAGFEDWSHWLPCDRAYAVPCESSGDRQPLTRATARAAGWQWRIPLQHRTGNGYVYASEYCSDDEAAATLLAHLDGVPLGDPKPLRFTAGRRTRAWIGNVVALGLAAGFLEPLESTAIHLVQTGIARLLALWPTRAFDQVEIDRFNAETARDYADIRDFLVLHYCTTERRDTPFWDRSARLPIPPKLADKLAMFRANGRIFRDPDELFTAASWLAVMVGKRVIAGGYHPAADMMSDDETRARLDHIRKVVSDTAAAMPRQADYLSSIGCDLTPLRRAS